MEKKLAICIVITLVISTLSLTPSSTAATEDNPDVIILWAGQNIEAGTVSVWNDADNIYIVFDTIGSWKMAETHLYVGKTDPTELTSAPGQFPYSETHNPKVISYPYTIALDDIDSYYLELNKKGKPTGKWVANGDLGVGVGDTVYIAAHASLSDENIMTIVSEAGVDVYGPLTSYAPVDDTSWGNPASAVATWVHGSWPTISGATWISNTYYIEEPIATDSWRWFHKEFNLPNPLNLISASLSVTSDNAEEFYFNDVLIGTDGEVQGAYVDDHEWNTILTYGITPQAGLNEIDFIVRNYPGSSDPTSNPTGLIYTAEICYATGETAWAEGTEFDNNWAMYFTYTITEPSCPCISDTSDHIEVLNYIPSNVQVGQLESTQYVRVWKEFEGELPANLYYDLDEGRNAKTDGPAPVGSFVIEAGTPVCVFFVHFDGVGGGQVQYSDLSITFGADILGVIISGGNLGTFANRNLMFAADAIFDDYTGTTYPTTSGDNYLRGYDVNYGINIDDVEFNGATVTFDTFVSNAHDQMRVILPLI